MKWWGLFLLLWISVTAELNDGQMDIIEMNKFIQENIDLIKDEEKEVCGECLAGFLWSCKYCTSNLTKVFDDVPAGERIRQDPSEIWENHPAVNCTSENCFLSCIRKDFHGGDCLGKDVCHCRGFDIHNVKKPVVDLLRVSRKIPKIECNSVDCSYTCENKGKKGKCVGTYVCECYNPNEKTVKGTLPNATTKFDELSTNNNTPIKNSSWFQTSYDDNIRVANGTDNGQKSDSLLNDEHHQAGQTHKLPRQHYKINGAKIKINRDPKVRLSKDLPLVGCRQITCEYTCDYSGYHTGFCTSSSKCRCEFAWRNPEIPYLKWQSRSKGKTWETFLADPQVPKI